MKKADMITGVVLLALSGFVIQETWRMPPSATFGPGPAFLPFWLGVLLAVFATILFVSSWRRPATEKEHNAIFPGKQALLAITLVMVGLGIYIFLIEVLGYLADTFLFIVFLMKAVEREKWPLTLMIAVGTTAVLFITFQFLLQITLPSNMFGF
jgi:putative tricarboxylic transport membrane protein